MLNWDALIVGEAPPISGENEEVLGHCPKRAPSFSSDLGHEESSNDAGSRGNAPSAPNAPSEKQGEDKNLSEMRAGREAVPSNLCAKFPISPVAVSLLVAYWESVAGDVDELAGALAGLSTMQPGDQEQAYAAACAGAGLDARRIIQLQSSGEGQECCTCEHLTTRKAIVPNTRQRYFWHCKLHYQVLEHFAGDRIVIAPPECNSYTRWTRRTAMG